MVEVNVKKYSFDLGLNDLSGNFQVDTSAGNVDVALAELKRESSYFQVINYDYKVVPTEKVMRF